MLNVQHSSTRPFQSICHPKPSGHGWLPLLCPSSANIQTHINICSCSYLNIFVHAPPLCQLLQQGSSRHGPGVCQGAARDDRAVNARCELGFPFSAEKHNTGDLGLSAPAASACYLG